MNARSPLAALLGAALAATAAPALAQQKTDLGQREFMSNCAVCHGVYGRGDGPYAGIDIRVPDITTLSQRNGGVFPFAAVYQTIDGTNVPKAHGTRDMPIWGQDYKTKAAEYYMDVPYDPDVFVRARILALTEYVYRLQAK
jgi:mono/diheme cytochrome c family protein